MPETPHKARGHKVLFKELLPLPKRERSKNPGKKTFTTHLMTSPENLEKVHEADEVSRKKEEKAAEKQGLIKKLIVEDKKNKKKVMCRVDTVKERILPTKCRDVGGQERGGTGRLGVRGAPKL